MTRGHLLILILTFLLSGISLYAQNDSIDDNAYYFDDGHISQGKNVIKINVASLVVGDLPIHYERTFGKTLALEVGLGILLPYYGYELFSEDTEITNPDIGYSLYAHPKYYLLHSAPELIYTGIQYRQRNYLQDNQLIVFSDYIIDFGAQLFLGKRIVLDAFYGVGFRALNEKTSNKNDGISGVVMPGGIKLGLLF